LTPGNAAPRKPGTGRAAFYCVSSRVYFLGAVGLINSLRLVGHREPIFLLDCGLTLAQRDLLAPHATVVPAPSDAPPYLLKTVAPLRHPAEVMVLVDADMIVTRPLTELVKKASSGDVVGFENYLDRFVPEWGELLGLGRPRRQAYLSSGLVFLGGPLGAEALRLVHECMARAHFDFRLDVTGKARVATLEDPFWALDQDVLNAVLATRVAPHRICVLDNRLAPNPRFPGLRILDEETLRCSYEDGAEPYVLHHISPDKPWLAPTYHGVYSRLLARLLLGEDVAVRVPESEVPLRMRSGPRARVARARVDVRDRLGWYLRDRLPESIMGRIDAFRRGRAARTAAIPDRGRREA